MNLLDRLAYDSGGYTVQEILSSFTKKIIEIIDLVNKNEEVCDEAHSIIENIRNEVVPELVKDIMKEMEDKGFFDSLVNVTLIEQLRTELTALLNETITNYTTLSNRLDNFDKQLDKIEIKNNGFVTPEQFKLDTDVDDTDSLQKAIDYCIANKLTLRSDKSLYLISRTLKIQEIINIEFGNATIRATSHLGSIFKINVTIRPNGVHVLGTEYGCISNITFDCNNMCDKCIYIEDGRKYLLDKLKIYNMNGVGIDIKAGYEITCNNIDMVGTHEYSVGIRITTSDCNFNDIVFVDVKRGIINGGTNFYNMVHGWMFTKELLATSNNPKNNSIFFIQNGGGTPQLNDCYSDTYFTSIYVTNHTRIFLNGFTVFYSEYVYNEELLKYTPYLFYYEKTTETNYSISDFSRQTIMTNSMIRGINADNYILMSNLPKGTSLIRCNSDNNVLTYVTGIEDNCVSGLNVKSDFSFTKNNCYNVVNRKDNRVTCKLKLYYEGGTFKKDSEYTLALFTDRYKPNMEFMTTAGISTDGYSSNFAPCYCYVSPEYGIKIKTPNDDIPTRKYVTVDLVFDMDYWV